MLATTTEILTKQTIFTQRSSAGFDDETLISACLLGNEQAWEMLLTRYSRLIFTIPLRFGFSASVAEEIFQEVCLVLLEKLDTLRDAAQFKPWLVTLTRRVCLQRQREQQQVDLDAVEGFVSDAEAPERIVLQVEQRELIHRALAMLDERCQQLLSALFLDPSAPSYEVLAKSLDVPVGSVGPIRARCLDKLRQALLELDHHETND